MRRALALTAIAVCLFARSASWANPITPRVYRIRPGDTVSEIAERFSVAVAAIVRENGLPGDGSRILAGEEILIPGVGPECFDDVTDGELEQGCEPLRFRLPADPAMMKVGSGEMALWLIVRPPTQTLLRAAGRGKAPSVLHWPVSSRRIGRGYGSGHSGRHFALDIPAPMGERVRAAAAGYVAYSGPFRGYGNTVLLVHPGGAVTIYAHLTRTAVRPRMRVRRGQVIGRSGSTGVSRGPHLHFGLYMDGKPVDAAPLLRPRPTYNGGRYGYEPLAAASEISAVGSATLAMP